MNKTLIIESLAIFSIVYEILKLILVKKYWKFGLRINRIKLSFFLVADAVYLGLVLGLILSHYYMLGLSVLVFSVLTAHLLRREYFSKQPINRRITTIIYCDSIASIIILAYLLFTI